jgi:four helix bundle protein
MPGYKKLNVYERAYRQALNVHKKTLSFPAYEKYELGSQLRRAAVSIMLNIAEGYGRRESAAEFQHFLRNALGSCNEVLVLLDFVRELGYLIEAEYKQLSNEYTTIGKQLYRLRQAWKPND